MANCLVCGAESLKVLELVASKVAVCGDCEAATLTFLRGMASAARRGKKHSLPLSLPPSFPPDPLSTHLPTPPLTGGVGQVRSRGPAGREPELFKTSESCTPEIEEVVDTWNGYFSLPRVQVIGKKAPLIRQALDNAFWLEHWRDGLKKLVKTPFCMGKARGRDGKLWKADFRWFIDPENLEKLLNGKYDGMNPELPKMDYSRDEI
jgi:hypothetical protein